VYGFFYAKELYRIYGEKIREWGIDIIVPVPLHRKRKRRRGYNQAEIIARHLGELTGIQVNTKLVFRNMYTNPQKSLDNKERIRNLQNAFQMGKMEVEGKHILLIDDIYTTGSTIDAIAKKFLENRHNKVWFLTISIGQGF
jgi:ComF family protein